MMEPALNIRSVPRAGSSPVRPLGPPGIKFDGYPVHLKNQWKGWYRIRYPTSGNREVRPPPIRAGDLPPPDRRLNVRSGCSPGAPPPHKCRRCITHGPEPPPLSHLRSPPYASALGAASFRADPEMWKHIPCTGPPQENLPPGCPRESRSLLCCLLARGKIIQGRVT